MTFGSEQHAAPEQKASSERARLQALRDYRILDTPAEQSFDDLTALAAELCEVPMALVSLIDADRQWFKSRLGVTVDQTPRDIAFCSHAIKGSEPIFVVPDTTLDARFCHNPLVTGEPRIRFYAGAPLIASGGHALGTICILDRQPRVLSDRQREMLTALSRQVVSQLELRRAATTNANLCAAVKQQSQRRARELQRDPLTRLMNRATFARCVEGRLAAARRAGRTDRSAVLLVDLDQFKVVNDMLGHAGGDALLAAAGNVIRAAVRKPEAARERRRQPDIVARLGGDEFTVLLNDLREFADAELVAQRILRGLRDTLHAAGAGRQFTASIGIAAIDGRAADVDAVLREADAAMSAAKAAGRDRVVFFDATMHAAALRRARLARDLRDAIETASDAPIAPGRSNASGLHLAYQPIVDLATGMPVAFEALARWRHPELGLISPGEFVPIAEEDGTILRFGQWVMQTAAAQLAEWRRADLATFRAVGVNVNVSRHQLVDRGLADMVERVIAETRVPSHLLRLEITESAIMEQPEAAAEMLDRLRALRVSLSMDDFGTGHSSLGCLRRFPFDSLKIDRSFVTTLPTDPTAAPVIRAIFDLARNLGMRVTVEGVETAEQVERLRPLGPSLIQGYFFSRPLTPDAAFKYVCERRQPRALSAAA